MNGFYNVIKPIGWSSSDVVIKLRGILRRQLGQKIKVGHLGTLDPLATGVLGVAVGSATKFFDWYLAKKKTYIATCFLGRETDTLDGAGKVIAEGEIPFLSDLRLADVLQGFKGEIDQIPPIYSAKSIDGVRAYRLAYKGIERELQPCRVTIHDIHLLERISDHEFCFRVECSRGTYIRSLCRDIGRTIGCPAYMSALTRIKNGDMTIENAVELTAIEEDISRGFTSLEAFGNSLNQADFSEDSRKAIENGTKQIVSISDGLVSVKIGGSFYGIGIVCSGEMKILARDV